MYEKKTSKVIPLKKEAELTKQFLSSDSEDKDALITKSPKATNAIKDFIHSRSLQILF